MIRSRPVFLSSPLVALPLLLSGGLAGCGGRTEATTVPLAELASRTLTYTLVDTDLLETPDAAGSHRFTVTFSQADRGCTRLNEGVVATFNGQPMTLNLGGVVDTGGRDSCEQTQAWLDFEPEAWAVEPIEDIRVFLEEPGGEHTVSLILRRAKTKRRFAYQGVGSGTTLRRGQTYSYLWEPVEEVPGPAIVTLLREEGRAPATLETTQEEGTVTFKLPSATPISIHLLRLLATTPGEVAECEGVEKCEGSFVHSSDYEVNVAQ
ncbi:hypothetical protein [Stigmatella aurantiaca]|uniref:Conserved uncharacterized protein n=1 Tax=Stigmatella aurantiaca (strain DW4/3-1) TaxID=378806 RepID=Q08U66_STIAD|nr:hypothetical protein [Stigmatella aurantiaca]ADO69419.1 conserved uncharacterized protein [Stigmatella aurantiaca DW4/3-1]EAU64018.1 hypothetical protein STIAU_1599 [Stigmatella aurantiaca DW4/3-1]